MQCSPVHLVVSSSVPKLVGWLKESQLGKSQDLQWRIRKVKTLVANYLSMIFEQYRSPLED